MLENCNDNIIDYVLASDNKKLLKFIQNTPKYCIFHDLNGS